MHRIATPLVVTCATVCAVRLTGLVGCTDPVPPPQGPVWSPGITYPSEAGDIRGLLDVRGLVHAHSVYSHDACDGEPVDENGVRDSVCFDDFRRGLCQSKHDFVFLTDHRESFSDTEFPETLLYRPERGDVLVEHDGAPTANFAGCDDGHQALIMAGNEAGLMPVGLERHVADLATRGGIYGERTPEAAQLMRDAGGVVLLAHPEDFSVDELKEMPLDGFEMYNLHANTFLGAGIALDLLLRAQDGDTGVPHPDLLVLAFWSEDQRYLQRWGNVLASGKRVTTTMGTDCHRNTFTTILADGERADSYRRMMIAFSNHLRIRPDAAGKYDDRSLKEALAAGRNYGVFEMMGYPVGFDQVATSGNATFEMGDAIPVGSRITVTRPAVKDLDPARTAPVITLRVLRAVSEPEGFVEVASTTEGTLDVDVTEPGAWRAEVRMLPLHLREDLGDDSFSILDVPAEEGRDYVWIYGGTFYAE